MVLSILLKTFQQAYCAPGMILTARHTMKGNVKKKKPRFLLWIPGNLKDRQIKVEILEQIT